MGLCPCEFESRLRHHVAFAWANAYRVLARCQNTDRIFDNLPFSNLFQFDFGLPKSTMSRLLGQTLTGFWRGAKTPIVSSIIYRFQIFSSSILVSQGPPCRVCLGKRLPGFGQRPKRRSYLRRCSQIQAPPGSSLLSWGAPCRVCLSKRLPGFGEVPKHRIYPSSLLEIRS